MAAATCGLCGASALAASSSGVAGLRPRSYETIAPPQCGVVCAGAKGNGREREEDKKSLFTSLTDALDFAVVRSEKRLSFFKMHVKRRNLGKKCRVSSRKRFTGPDFFQLYPRSHSAKPMSSAQVLRKLVDDASKFLNDKVTNCCHHAYFNDSQRTATKDAGRIAGVE